MTGYGKIRCLARAVLLSSFIFSLLWHLSCSDRGSPEDEIRSWLEKASKAAEERDLRTLRDLVSDNYSDDEGRDKKLIQGILTYHLLHNRSIHLLKKVKTIKIVDPNSAELAVAVALAGQPIGSGMDLTHLQADMLRFNFMLHKGNGDDWQVIAAKWISVDISEFM
ncbi:MAG: hypothetical protein GTO42_01040 [Candidatus Latescibacteria bacterium]|nr:hypothetical protein [Candidatus Latescibacterota bacterium]NIO27114.1 hypothetical protein [Candidatus Latescibacterota bacterium]NIO54638.1 hypothetical protein [Candidatus Latescibacterota bacterium]NIT00721.1 hypothetical protein [Candidatus Latescibacterota bacterium]NIT37644.1 hypothetical protein [Candidatus Latescibacterota bacterium]